MLHGGDGARKVDQVHDAAAQKVAEGIGVVRQRQFGVLRFGFPDETWFVHICPV